MPTSKDVIQKYLDLGINVMPVDTHKRPTGEWKRFQENMIVAQDLNAPNIGAICGKISGNLEVIDLDQKYYSGNLLKELGKLVSLHNRKLWENLVVQETVNGGWHLLFRCPDGIDGNVKLASRYATEKEKEKGDKIKVLIETRGEGGFICVWPSKGYKFLKNKLRDIPVITKKERALLLTLCKEFDETGEVFRKYGNEGEKPWEHYDREHTCREVLEKNGWSFVYADSKREHFRRPGETSSKTSGNVLVSDDLFKCFSTSTEFESEKCYTASGVLCVLEFGGDWKKCGQYLARSGYGEKVKEQDLSDVSSLLAAPEEMNKNINDIYDGNVEKGNSLGIYGFDYYILYRKNAFYFMVGRKGGGKSTIMFYLLFLDAWKNGSKYLMAPIENSPFSVRNTLVSFALESRAEEVYKNHRSRYTKALSWVDEHFKFLNYKEDWTLRDVLKIARELGEIESFSGILIDPYNAMKVPNVQNSFQYHVDCGNDCRMFSQRHFSVFLTAHPTSGKQREGTTVKDVDAEFGGAFPNKADFTFAIDRSVKAEDPTERNTTRLSVDKVRDADLFGGHETSEESPIILEFMGKNYGFRAKLPIPEGGGYEVNFVNLKE